MAILTIDTFLVVDEIDPASQYHLTGDLDGVLETPFPRGVFFGLYGRMSAVIARDLHKSLAKSGKELLLCSVEIESGPNMQNRVDVNVTSDEYEATTFLSDLREMKTVDVRRGRKRLWDDISQKWDSYLNEMGLDPVKMREAQTEDFPRRFTTYPNLISRLRAEDDYKHLDCIVFPLLTKNQYLVKIAAVFNPEAVVNVTVKNSKRIEAEIPASVWKNSLSAK